MKGVVFHFWGEGKVNVSRRFLLGLVICAFLLRIPLLIYPEVIHNDGAEYIRHAKLILSGNWTGGKAPPLYPALIAFAHLFIPDAERAGILISIIFGTLLALPVFYLGKEIFDERVGILSGLIVAVHPFLNSYSGSVLTESTYYFLVALIVLTGWYAFQRGRVMDVIYFGFLTSLAYLTRPEGIGFLMVFSFWILIVNPSGRKRNWTKRFGFVFLAAFCFLLLSGPYLMQIRKETGRWGITKKFAISMESSSKEDGAQSIEAFTKKKEINLLSLVKNPLIVLKKIVVGFFQSLYKFQQAYNPLLFFFALLALVFCRAVSFSLKSNLYLFAYFFFFLGLILPFLWVARRYTSQMIPIAIPWAAFGCMGFTGWVSSRFKGGILRGKIPIFLIIVLLVGLFVQGRVIHGRDHRIIQRDLGLWMKDHLSRETKVMSRLPQEAFYAELPWERLPDGNYEEILRLARSKQVRYIVIGEDVKSYSPDFLEKANHRSGLRQVYELKKKDQWLIVWEYSDVR